MEQKLEPLDYIRRKKKLSSKRFKCRNGGFFATMFEDVRHEQSIIL